MKTFNIRPKSLVCNSFLNPFAVHLLFYESLLNVLVSPFFGRSKTFFARNRAKVWHSIILILFVVYTSELNAQATVWLGDDITTEQISTEQGLSSRSVNCILQDRNGFIWIGTQNGLNKFDGEKVIVYFNDINNPASLSKNDVYALCEDKTGTLWIGTGHGLDKFNPATNSFQHYFYDPNDPHSLSDNTVRSIYEDRSGALWIGTFHGLNKFDRERDGFTRIMPDPKDSTDSGNNIVNVLLEDRNGELWMGGGFLNAPGGGLSRLDRTTGKIIHYRRDYKKNNSLLDDWVTALYEDKDGTLWIGTNSGICTFNREKKTFQLYRIVSSTANRVHSDFVKAISENSEGTLWIGTWGMGVFKFNTASNTVTQYTHDAFDPGSIASPNVMTLFHDRSGLLWVGTWGGGVSIVSKKPFVHYNFLAQTRLSNNGVSALSEDKHGNLYIGTNSSGVWKYNTKKKILTSVPLPSFFPSFIKRSTRYSPTDRYITSINSDTKGSILIGSQLTGELIKYNPQTNRSSVIFRAPVTHNGRNELVNCFFPDNDGTIWVGSDKNLFHIDSEGKLLSQYFHDKNNSKSLSTGWINTIMRDHTGNLWIGMLSGLNLFDSKTGTVLKYFQRDNAITSLSNNEVLSFYEDQQGRLWIGTANGINRFERSTGTFSRFTSQEGLAGRIIHTIQCDAMGNMWVATDAGISRIDGKNDFITNFNQANGLPIAEYSFGEAVRRASGELLFGTNTGILAFHPNSVKQLLYVPQIVITGIKKSNETVLPSTLPELIHEIILEHDESVMAISFSALSYEKYVNNQYAYMLEGFDKTWNYCGTKREAIYTNLDPGKYTFRVKGSNHDGVWSVQDATLSIIVLAPWYQQWWAYGLYMILFLSVITSLYRVRVNRFKLEQKVIVEHLQAEKLSELNAMKSRFLANVSHELRTPLSLILGPINSLLAKNPDKESKENLGIIERNAQRLLRLIELLLQFSRLEAGTINLRVAYEDVVSLLRRITGYFSSPAAKKQIEMKFIAEQENINGLVDAEKIEHILQNCISNAIKFTPSGGTIKVSVRTENNDLVFSTNDTGEGIAPEHLPHVFERFYRVDPTHKTEGTGIGLSLSRELAEIHHGSMHIESELGKGTIVTVRFPLSGYNDSEIVTKANEDSTGQNHIRPLPSPIATESIVTTEELPIILIAEDNEDARAFMRTQLVNHYTILEAEDGLDALNKTKFQIPDLVISDVMMPKKDGRELCKELKQDERTSHIPVILLTALAEKEDKIEGLNVGADDYLVKPFDSLELLTRVKNLLENRKKLREAFGKTVQLKPGEISVTSLDNQFLQKSIDVVSVHLSDPSFGVDTFAHEIFLSRTQLHRKLKAITNLSATDFIRHLRLQRAKELLEKNSGTVAEIADAVGFTNHSYFAKCYYEEFGLLPNEVRRPQK